MSDEIQNLLCDLTRTAFDNVNEATDKLTEIIQLAFQRVFPNRRHKNVPPKCQRHNKRETFLLRVSWRSEHLRWLGGNSNGTNIAYPEDKSTLMRKRSIKNFLNPFLRNDKIKSVLQIQQLDRQNPREFCSQIKRLTSPSGNATNLIHPDKWVCHFQNIFQTQPPEVCDSQCSSYVKSSLPHLEQILQQSEILNWDITDAEVEKEVKTLKSGKSFYLDDISNESLNSGHETWKRPFKHLSNICYQKASFPEIWRDGFIVPIHTTNDILDVNNYRGIIISSCIGKLLLKILTKRIDMSMRSTYKWSVNQCGFKPDHRTEEACLF